MKAGIDFRAYLSMAEKVKPDVLESPTDGELISSDSLRPDILELYEHGYRPGVSTGWLGMDPFFTVRAGEFTVITGHPGSGKSSWLDNVMINTSRRHGWKWAVFSAENYPVSRHIAGLSEIYSGKPFLKGPTPRLNRMELDLCLKWVARHFRFIQPKEDRYSLDRIIQIAFSAGDVDGVVIDPWNELDHSRPRDLREDEFISISLTKLRWFARNANVHLFVVAHPSKYTREPGKSKPVATLNDVKGASEWYAKADNGVSVWRDEGDQTGASDIHIQKVRFREVGRAGHAVRLYYNRVTGRFTDPTQPETIDDLVAQHQLKLDEPFEGQF